MTTGSSFWSRPAVPHACWDGIGTRWAHVILALSSLSLARRRVREGLQDAHAHRYVPVTS
jgi:hypothetical protein